MTLNLFSSGPNTTFSDELNENYNVLSKQNLINRLNHERAGTIGRIEQDGLVHDFVEDATDNSYIDTSNSDCYYDEGGNVGFCDVLDLCNDGSVDSDIWSDSTSTSGGAEATVSENSEYLEVYSRAFVSSESDSANASVITNGTNGLDLSGGDAEVLLRVNLFTDDPDDNGSGYARLQLSDGSNHVNIKSQSVLPQTTESNTYFLRLVYDDSAEKLYVYTDGGDTPAELDVSSLTNKYLRATTNAFEAGTQGGDVNGRVRFYAVGYRKDGASAGTATFATPTKTINSSDSVFFYAQFEENIKPTNPTAVASMNGGSSFSTDESFEQWDTLGTPGTSLQVKLTGDKPTSITADGSTKNIPVLKAWGALHD